jgi:hypothetical protein
VLPFAPKDGNDHPPLNSPQIALMTTDHPRHPWEDKTLESPADCTDDNRPSASSLGKPTLNPPQIALMTIDHPHHPWENQP